MVETRGRLPYFPALIAKTGESCPVASRFIKTASDAKVYYANRLVGDHKIEVRGELLCVRFNPEEIHPFTSEKEIAGAERVSRPDRREVRWFDRERARALDEILPTLTNPARVLAARIQNGRMVYGPATANARRYCVIVAQEPGNVFFVRTAYPVTREAFARAVRSQRASDWPPK